MNPLTNVKNLNAMNERELDMGYAGTKNSWHWEYKDSAWIFIGGLPYELTEGDLLAVFSQYGEIVHVNLVRDHGTGKSRGFGFLCYEDQRSTILAVDNLNGIRLCKRTLRVDHVQTYKLPKDLEKMDADRRRLFEEGCAPKAIQADQNVEPEEADDPDLLPLEPDRKAKKKSKKKKKKRRYRSSSSSSDSSADDSKKFQKDEQSKKKKREDDGRVRKTTDERGRRTPEKSRRERKESYHRSRRRSRSRSTERRSRY